MKYRIKFVSKKHVHFVTRLMLAGMIVYIYFLAWRPARIAIAEKVIYPQLKSFQTANNGFQIKWEADSVLIQYRYNEVFKELHYRPGFGFFFLIALIALLFFTQKPAFYTLLIIINAATSLIAYTGLLTGATGAPIGFMITDMANAYLTPALSLAIIPFAMKSFPKLFYQSSR